MPGCTALRSDFIGTLIWLFSQSSGYLHKLKLWNSLRHQVIDYFASAQSIFYHYMSECKIYHENTLPLICNVLFSSLV